MRIYRVIDRLQYESSKENEKEMKSKNSKLHKSIKILESKRLKLLEEIYGLQKEYERLKQRNQDLKEHQRIEVFSKSQDRVIDKTKEKDFTRLDVYKSSNINSRKQKDKFNSTMQNYKKNLRYGRNHSQSFMLKKMNTAEDLILSKNWKLKLFK